MRMISATFTGPSDLVGVSGRGAGLHISAPILPPRQAEVLEFIERALAAGRAPSYREIAAAIGVTSIATINKHVHALERKGFVTMQRFKQRALRATGNGRRRS